MDSNNAYVDRSLQRQRVLLEEKQRQRRLQSAGAVRSTQAGPSPGMQASNSLYFTRFREDSVLVPMSSVPSSGQQQPPQAVSIPEVKVIQRVQQPIKITTVTGSNRRPSQTGITSTNLAHYKTTTMATSSTLPNIAQTKAVMDKEKEKEKEKEDLIDSTRGALVTPLSKTSTTISEGGKLDEVVIEDPDEGIDVSVLLSQLDKFVQEPCRRGGTMRCTITRDKKGVDKGWYPAYYLHWEKDHEKRFFLLAARRRKKALTASYLISTDPTELSREARSFAGKVRANAVGTCFTVYDNGVNPKKSANMDDEFRQELAAVIYEPNVFGLKGPRKMTVLIPGMCGEGMNQPRAIRPVSEKDGMIERFRQQRIDEMIVLSNKTPVWSEETQSYVLNFRGRVTQASVKNFQIIHNANPDYIVLQFGRTDDSSFTLDFRYPLTPLQAFGIAMSSFHNKLACE